MKLYLFDNDCRYAAEQILLTMFPSERPEYPEGPPCGDRAELYLHRGEKLFTACCRLYLNGSRFLGKASVSREQITDELTLSRFTQRIIKLSF